MPSVDAASNALTTVAAALAYLGEPNDSTGKTTDRLQILINAYSTSIHRYTKRQIKPPEDDVEKIFRYNGDGYLTLAPFEARAITTVTLYTDMPTAGWMVLQNQDTTHEAQWRAEPRQKSPEGTYLRLSLPEIGQFHPIMQEIQIINRRGVGHEVTIHGDWGMAAVPGDVELACLIAVANGFRNPESFQARSLGPLSFAEDAGAADESGASLPRDTRMLLRDLRRRVRVR